MMRALGLPHEADIVILAQRRDAERAKARLAA
jgi:hypothetical protein